MIFSLLYISNNKKMRYTILTNYVSLGKLLQKLM
nr:MAG TPA: hypothetical protein [Crassvirales sp.]